MTVKMSKFHYQKMDDIFKLILDQLHVFLKNEMSNF